jgi:hypothetical protein
MYDNDEDEEDEITTSSSLSAQDDMDVDQGRDEISEEDDQEDDYRPKGPSTMIRTDVTRAGDAGRSKGTRSGGVNGKPTNAKQQVGRGNQQGRGRVVEDRMEVDERESEGRSREIDQKNEAKHDDDAEEEEEEEEEEYTQKEPIDLQ